MILSSITSFLLGLDKFLILSTSVLISYVAYICDPSYKRSGRLWPAFQKLNFWKRISQYFDGDIVTETPLNHEQQYIFCNFPHGACTLNHLLTMTDCCGMLSNIYMGPRRDLAATILFMIPVVRDVLLLLGCVDASSNTAHYNMSRGRSILIFIGGEKEQVKLKTMCIQTLTWQPMHLAAHVTRTAFNCAERSKGLYKTSFVLRSTFGESFESLFANILKILQLT